MALKLDFTPIGRNGTGTISAKMDGKLIASDKLDVSRATSRARFAKQLTAAHPVLKLPALEAELLQLAGRLAEKPGPETSGNELDASRIARPELFHTAEVSDLCVPVRKIIGGSPRGLWELYLRWHGNGRREARELEASLDLPEHGRLWIHPMPGDPEPTMAAAWSRHARRAWLEGDAAPDAVEVWQRIAERIAHYVDFPPDVASSTVATLSLWVMFTYIFPAWASVPYLAVGGPKASGKTTLFRVLARLVFRPVESSNMTAPCLFRTLNERGGVLLLDEAERLREGTSEAVEIRSILLSGYKRGSPASRLEKCGDNGFRRIEFDVFSPKALACIGGLPEALASRCIRVSMFRAAADSPKPRRRLDAEPAAWAGNRDDLHALALEHGATWLELVNRVDVVPACFGGRDFELWQPLLALASWLEDRGAMGLLGTVQEHAERLMDAAHDDSVPEVDEALLRIVAEYVVGGGHQNLKAGDVLKRAREADPVTFQKWSPKGVAGVLGRHGLRTHHDGRYGRTYSRVSLAALQRIERAYGFDLSLPVEDVSNVSNVPEDAPGRLKNEVR